MILFPPIGKRGLVVHNLLIPGYICEACGYHSEISKLIDVRYFLIDGDWVYFKLLTGPITCEQCGIVESFVHWTFDEANEFIQRATFMSIEREQVNE